MSQDTSTPAPATQFFFPSSMSDPATIGSFRRLIRSHPAMAWARQCSMQDDFEQLGLIEAAKILQTFDPAVGTTPEQYVGVALRKRLFSCRRALNRFLADFAEHADRDQDEEEPEADGEPENHLAGPGWEDDSFERKQMAERLATCINALPKSQQAVTELLLQDYTEAETARELGVTVQAVNKAKNKAIKALKDAMAQYVH